MRKLIVTGDDFGMAIPVNEAVEIAHRDGILQAASLMVGGEAADDAVERAQRLPSLRVGLHVVLVEGRPMLPPEQVPDLVDGNGEFRGQLAASGLRFFFRPGIRRQLEAEIRAQFEAFRKTGLALDHVNAHNHMHLHPTVLSLLLRVGREYGLAAIRVPYEPPQASWRASGEGRWRRALQAFALAPWTSLLRSRLRRGRIKSNDFVFGLHDTGRMEESLVLRQLGELPEGITEMYFHAATRRCPEIDRIMPDYRHQGELAALTSARVRETLAALGIQPIAFGDLPEPGR
ncbi:MAG: hopanoid biosynthesis-associated protein HpnK [Myxococcota bacterium]